MKFSTSHALLLLAPLVSAVPARRQFRGLLRRDATTVTITVTNTAVTDVYSTTTVYSSSSSTSSSAALISSSSSSSSSSSAIPTTAAAAVPSTSKSSAAAVAPTSSSSSSSSSSSGSSSGGSSGNLANWQAPSVAFVDGKYDCSAFPSDQPGVVALNYLNFGGWSGVQQGDAAGNTCSEGSYCSYACQPGMSKTQWPSSQPSDGQSRGGLLCQGGKLYRTNTNTQYLCEWGAQTAYFKSQLSGSVAVCRTDYPGSENMVVPSVVGPNGLIPVSVVDSGSYYQWEGKPTSSQYYLNNMGVSQQDGCVWGTAGSNLGNFAPLNLGAGQTNGLSYLSILPNPNCATALNFNVKIVAAAGGVINGDCSYENGVYSGGANGCTVTVTSGAAYFEFY